MNAEPLEQLDLQAIQAIFDHSSIIRFLGLKVLGLDHDKGIFSARMPLRDELERGVGTKQFHGGPVASFIRVQQGVSLRANSLKWLAPIISAACTVDVAQRSLRSFSCPRC